MSFVVAIVLYLLCAAGSVWLHASGASSPPLFWMLGGFSVIIPVGAALLVEWRRW